MRILASNPDSIGDVVLRQPMYAAIREAGHDLRVVVRGGLVPVMTAVVPGAEVLATTADPYGPGIDWGRQLGMLAAADAFDPEVFLVAPYQWTPLEEGLAERLPAGVRKVGMTGRLYPGDPRGGLRNEPRMKLDVAVEVSEEVPELRKNELLCAAVLGRAVELPKPRLTLSAAQRRAGAAALQRCGMSPGGYWVACVGHHDFTRVRNWDPERWGEALAYWARAYGRRFVMIGTKNEQEISRRIAERVDREVPGAAAVANGLDLDAMMGVVEASAGYVGRDTGPMHVAAALAKPVVAVFGGGTWPRFTPAAEPSRVVTVGVPCVGCDWLCHLEESHCVKAVTVERVKKAIDDMEAGRITGAEVDVLEPDAVLSARMLREAGAGYRGMVARASLAEAAAARAADVSRELAETGERLRQATKLTEDLRARLYRQEAEAADLRVKLAQSEAERAVMSGLVRQVETTAKADVTAARKAAKTASSRLKEISASRWHKLGRMLGLRLVTAEDPDPASRGRENGKVAN